MTVTRSANGDTFQIKKSQAVGWLLSMVLVPAATAFGTLYVQAAVFGEKIANLQAAQSKFEIRENQIDERLRTIEMQLARVLSKLESIK